MDLIGRALILQEVAHQLGAPGQAKSEFELQQMDTWGEEMYRCYTGSPDVHRLFVDTQCKVGVQVGRPGQPHISCVSLCPGGLILIRATLEEALIRWCHTSGRSSPCGRSGPHPRCTCSILAAPRAAPLSCSGLFATQVQPSSGSKQPAF